MAATNSVSSHLKPLHLAKSMKELNSMSTKNKLGDLTPRMLSKSSEKLYLSAYDKYCEGDQEHAYILLLRYLDVAQAVRNSKECKQNKKQMDTLFDKQKFKKALEDAEKLSKELSERFELLNDKAMDITHDPPVKEDQNKDFFESCENGLISCEMLYNILTSRSDEVLVVDCRIRKQVMLSTVHPKKCPQWLSIPQEVIQNNGNFTAFLSTTQEKIWNERGKNGRPFVILVDSRCELEPNSAITIMKSLLVKDDSSMRPLVLDGGYNKWYLSYSPLCVGKWMQEELPNGPKKPITEPDIESFNYPSSEKLIPPKPKSLPAPPPSVEEDMKMESSPPQQPRNGGNIMQLSRDGGVTQQQYNGPLINIPAPNELLPQPAIHLLPPVPSVPLPLELEGRDKLFDTSYSSVVDQPHPSYYLDSQYYSEYSDTGYLDQYDISSNIPTAPLYDQVHNQQYNHHQYHGDINSQVFQNPHQEHQYYNHITDNPTGQQIVPNSSNVQFPINPQYSTAIYSQPSNEATQHVMNGDPNGNTNPQNVNMHVQPSNETMQPVMDGDPNGNTDLYVQPSSGAVHPVGQLSEGTVQPDPQLSSSTVNHVMMDSSNGGSNMKDTSNVDPSNVDPSMFDQREKELRDRHQDMMKQTEDQRKTTEEQIKQLFKEEHRKLEKERAEMQSELQKQREKNEQELAEMKLKAQKEMELQLSAKMKELDDLYKVERASVLKNKEEMKHYWEITRQQENDNRQFVSNQGLPQKWEKRLDRTTGRFYYVDHSNRTTHWNPPTSILHHQAELQRQQQKQQQQQHHPSQPPNKQTPLLPSGPQPPLSVPSGPQPPLLLPSGPQPPLLVPSQPKQMPNPNNANPTLQPHQMPPPQQQVNKPMQPNTVTGGRPSAPQHSIATSTPTPTPPPPPSNERPSIDRTNKPTVASPSNVQQMTVEVYKRKMASLQPILGSQGPGLLGLTNIGNTCFMNSVIQCMFATPPLMKFFVSNKYRAELNRENPLGSGGVLAEEFFILCRASWVERFKQITPREFKSMIARVAPYFSGNEQHDSQEFLMYFLDGLHEDLNRVKVKKYIEIPDVVNMSDAEAAKQAWDIHTKRNNSIIIDLFYGILKSVIQCLTCSKRKVMFEPFLSLSLPIPDNCSSCSYSDCLKLFGAAEKLYGDNKWFCPQCKQQRDAVKKLSIWRLPPVLLLHFKRFKDGRGTVREKMTTHISFPIENLNLDQIIVGQKPKIPYNLYAISNHIGNLGSGHYTACCKNARDGQFYLFNDEIVKPATSRDLSSSSAYLLFYTCQDFRSLKL